MDICFIVYGNDDYKCEECIEYVSSIAIPDGIEVELFSIIRSNNLIEEINEIVSYSDATIKVYVNENILLINKNFISDMTRVLCRDNSITTLGVGIGIKIINNESFRVGKALIDEIGNKTVLFDEGSEYLSDKDVIEVDSIAQGLVIMVNDKAHSLQCASFKQMVDWRCEEQKKNNCKAAIIYSDDVWCIIGSGAENE